MISFRLSSYDVLKARQDKSNKISINIRNSRGYRWEPALRIHGWEWE
jgi:hypothetical protein